MTERGVPARVFAVLDAGAVRHRTIEHAPAYDADQAARLRGTPLAIGAKALVFKLDRGIGFAVFALPADHTVDNRRLRRHLGVRRYRFATPAELAAVTTLEPGAVPPFGRPVFDLPLYVDQALAGSRELAFTAGSHTVSVVLATADWLAVAHPTDVFSFATPSSPLPTGPPPR
ncbi:MAG: YbaK/EbsC family protein [Myxococcota bacterium]